MINTIMRSRLFLFLLLLNPLLILAQTKISGKVADEKGQAVPGANVFIKDTYDGASTGADGKFSFTTEEKGEHILAVSFLGYENHELKINISGIEINITAKLKEKATELNTAIVSAGAFEASDEKKMVMLRPLDIVTTAGAAGDVYGAIQTLPGTQIQANETGLFVRGGDASESKTIIDGVVVDNPYYSSVPDVPQRGRFSPFLFKGTNFSTGGYSAQYGQAMSSALILESQDLADKTTTNINVMSVGAGITHTHRWKNTSLSATGNYVNLTPYYALVPQNRDWGRAPQSASGSLVFRQKTSATGLLKAFVNYQYGDLSINYPNLDDTSGNANYNYTQFNNNVFTQVNYKDVIKGVWTVNSDVAYSHNNNNLHFTGDHLVTVGDLGQARIVLSRGIGQLTSIRFGGEVQKPVTKNDFNNFDYHYNETYTTGFAETDLYITRKLVSRLGVRAEHSQIMNKWNVAPRISLAYKVGNNEQFSFAYGDFYQTPDERWLQAKHDLNFEKATHYILNFQHLDDKRTFRVEAYYKNYDRLLRTSPDTNVNGFGYAKGIDVFYRDKKTIKYGDFWISYSYLDTKRLYSDFPIETTPTFGAKHTFTTVFKYFFPKISLSAGFTYTYSSGRPYYNPNAKVYLSDKTKPYNNLSLNFSYLTSIAKHFTVIAFSVNNVLGFENVFSYNYSSDGLRRDAVGQTSLRSFFIGVFVSIGEERNDDN
ncbi:MAG: TonB-dependent receptor [Bacteroidia bacterium]